MNCTDPNCNLNGYPHEVGYREYFDSTPEQPSHFKICDFRLWEGQVVVQHDSTFLIHQDGNPEDNTFISATGVHLRCGNVDLVVFSYTAPAPKPEQVDQRPIAGIAVCGLEEEITTVSFGAYIGDALDAYPVQSAGLAQFDPTTKTYKAIN